MQIWEVKNNMKKKYKTEQLKNTLNKVFEILTENKNMQILPVLDQYRNSLSSCNVETKELYYRFMAFGHLREKNLTEAEKYIELLSNKDILDVKYILTTINFHLREFEKTIENGKEYLILYSKDSYDQISHSDSHNNNILNLIGNSLMMLRRFDEADKIFKNALKVDQENPQTYINMIRLAKHLKDDNAVDHILESAFRNCPDNEELKLLAGFKDKSQNNCYSRL